MVYGALWGQGATQGCIGGELEGSGNEGGLGNGSTPMGQEVKKMSSHPLSDLACREMAWDWTLAEEEA